MNSLLTTHVLDTTNGCAAAGVPVRVEFAPRAPDDDPARIGEAVFAEIAQGGQSTLYPVAQILVHLDRDTTDHYHIPLLLSRFSYSTYRGT